MSDSIGERLKLIRNELMHTQKSMSDSMGLGIRTWQTYELDQSLPKVETLNQLAAMGYSVDWILTGAGNMRPPPGFAEVPAAFEPRPIDGELMGRIVDQVEKLYKEENVRIAPIDKGRLAAEIYSGVDFIVGDAERMGAIRYIIQTKRAELRRTPSNEDMTKRQA